jgi:hypothetical protein
MVVRAVLPYSADIPSLRDGDRYLSIGRDTIRSKSSGRVISHPLGLRSTGRRSASMRARRRCTKERATSWPTLTYDNGSLLSQHFLGPPFRVLVLDVKIHVPSSLVAIKRSVPQNSEQIVHIWQEQAQNHKIMCLWRLGDVMEFRVCRTASSILLIALLRYVSSWIFIGKITQRSSNLQYVAALNRAYNLLLGLFLMPTRSHIELRGFLPQRYQDMRNGTPQFAAVSRDRSIVSFLLHNVALPCLLLCRPCLTR